MDEAQNILEWVDDRLDNSAKWIVMHATLAFHRGRYDHVRRTLRPVLDGVPGLLAWMLSNAWLLECQCEMKSGNSRNACLALARALAIFERIGVTRALGYAQPDVVELLSQQIGNMGPANSFAQAFLAGARAERSGRPRT